MTDQPQRAPKETPEERRKRLELKYWIREHMMVRKPPDELDRTLADGVAKGELEYDIQTRRYRLTKKGDAALRRAVNRLG